MKLSKKVLDMELSPIRKFVPYADAARAAGKKVYGLNIGQPDIKTPQAFFDAVKNYDEEVLAYANSQGVSSLLDALVGYYKRIGLDFEKKDLMVTNGGSEAINMLMTAILDDGDEVIMAEPFYTNYKTFVGQAGGKVVAIPTTADDGYQYAVREKIEKVLSPKTKIIAIINPGEFVYDGKEMSSFGSFKEAEQNVIIVDSVSKRFSACGARIGSIACKNEELMMNIMKLAQARLCCPTIDQVGAAALYNLDPSYFDDIKKEYEHRRDVSVEALNEIEGIKYGIPEGAFYITAQLPVDDAEKFLMFLLTEFDVNGETCMFAPAGGFFSTKGVGQSDMRIAYVLNAEDMKAGINIIKEGIKAYNNR